MTKEISIRHIISNKELEKRQA